MSFRRWLSSRTGRLASLLTCVVAGTALLALAQPMFVLRALARNSPCAFFYEGFAERVVALTIDDAPHRAVTPQVLGVLAAHAAHATFFVIGSHVRGNEDLLESIRQGGHELGNHLADEYPSILLSREEFSTQLAQVDAMIRPAGRWKWFRPGSGWYSGTMAKQARVQGYRCALGSVYPFDTTVRSEWLISQHIERSVFPGSIIVIHDGKPDRIRSAAVLERVLPALTGRGYRIVTLSELAALAEAHSPRAP